MLLLLTGLAQGDVPVPVVVAAMARQHFLHQGQELQPPVLPEHLLQEHKESLCSVRETALLTPAFRLSPHSKLCPEAKHLERLSSYSRGQCFGQLEKAVSLAFVKAVGLFPTGIHVSLSLWLCTRRRVWGLSRDTPS